MAGNSAEPGRSVTSKIVAILLTFRDGNEHSLTEIARLVTRQRHGTSGPPRPRDHLVGLREHHRVAGADSSTGGAAGRWRRR
jgi:hypothetical protein